jgi:hypothetical protein
MKTRRVSIATVSLVREPGEETVLRGSLQALAALDLPVCVADGGSGDAFTSFIRGLPGFTLVPPKGPGLVGQVAAALGGAAAGGREFVFYTESDKAAFFETELAGVLGRTASLLDRPALALASRSADAFATFPPVQRHTEAAINDLCSESFGAAGDYSYGPFLMHCSLVPWIARVPLDLGWGWRHFIFAIAHRLGHRITHVPGDFVCPPDQRTEGDRERLHRLKQLDQNVSGLQAGLTLPLD